MSSLSTYIARLLTFQIKRIGQGKCTSSYTYENNLELKNLGLKKKNVIAFILINISSCNIF